MSDKPFTIYVMQSAHTDIGFTHPQEQIMSMYLDYYDRVLDLCRQTEHDPEISRFKWTCETFWQVRHYLTARPERLDEFVYFVRTGQIEITAAYLHFTDLIDVDAYRQSVMWAVDFCRQHELPLRCAMHCDINGWAWAVADILAENNIPFFYSSVHTDSATEPLGARGTAVYFWLRDLGAKYLSKYIKNPLRADLPTRIPRAFWWQGPTQGRVLHWLGELYLTGNFLGLSSPREFHADKTRHFVEADQTTVDEMYAMAQREVPRYIKRLQAQGYPHDAFLMQTGGFNVDNSPPDDRWCGLIARWNAENESIKLRTSTISEWFELVQSWGTQNIPTYQVAWPDHWAHGLGAATARIAQARSTQRRRAAVGTFVNSAQSAKAQFFLDKSFEQELLSLEHTFNAWSTTAHPQSSMNDFLETAKELMFHRAELYLDEAISTALRDSVPTSPSSPQLFVPPAEEAIARQLVHFSSGDITLSHEIQSLVDADGKEFPFQQDHDDLSQFVAVLPASKEIASFQLLAKPSIAAPFKNSQRMETDAWVLEIDSASGGLKSLQDVTTGYEWVNSENEYGFGQLVHETVIHPLGREAAGNLARYIALDMANENAREVFTDTPVFSHECLAIQGQSKYTSGSVFDVIELDGAFEDLGDVKIGWRCYHTLPVVELIVDWNKHWSDLPEAAYITFPFRTDDGEIKLETSGGFFKPGDHDVGGQLKGTCSTYYTMQRAAHITNRQNDLLWLPIDAPLVMTNELNYNRWEATTPYKWNGFIASMPINHYWHTNFAISQRGYIRLRYRFIKQQGFEDINVAIKSAMPINAFGWQ